MIKCVPPTPRSHQIRTYTQRLITDTTNLLNELINCKERHLKIQRDRLVDEFTAALTAFQSVQRKTVDLEKNAVRQARGASGAVLNKPPGGGSSNHSSMGSYGNSHNHSSSSNAFEDNFVSQRGGQTQEQLQEEIDLQALENQEQTIRELEVCLKVDSKGERSITIFFIANRKTL